MLLTVEHRIRTGEPDPLRPLIELVRGDRSKEAERVELTLHDHAPYPELRRAILSRLVEEHPGLTVDFSNDRRAVASVTNRLQRLRLEGLYHWSVRDLLDSEDA